MSALPLVAGGLYAFGLGVFLGWAIATANAARQYLDLVDAVGPCMETLDPFKPGSGIPPISCELTHGHVGGHSNEKGTRWTNVAVESRPGSGELVAAPRD
jgi:hypothetical protein